MFFRDIVGQDRIKKQLIKSVKDDRISHAQMFLGSEGVGKLPLAIAYSRYILCQNRGEEDACGSCPSCVKVNNFQHPDLHFSYPIILGAKSRTSDAVISEWRDFIKTEKYMTEDQWYAKIGGENKVGVIGKDESQDIVKKLSLKSFAGGYKIMIVWKAERLNASSANKLLKIIEEPPKNTLFLFTAESDESMLPTIISRTQIIKFLKLNNQQIAEGLSQRGYAEKGEEIAFLSEGNLSRALILAGENNHVQKSFDDFMQWMRFAFTKDVNGAILWVEDFVKNYGRESQKSFLNFSLKIFRECLINNHLGLTYVKVSDTQKGTLQKFAPFVTDDSMFTINDLMNEALYHIERNANPKILFLDLSFKLFSLIKKN